MTTTGTRPSATPPHETLPSATRSRLRGSLGVASIVFIVVAAASPLGVIGGPVPLGIAFGNGAGVPHERFGSPARASLAASSVVLVLVAVAVVLGLDPITELYTWLDGVSSVGIVLLLAGAFALGPVVAVLRRTVQVS